MTVVANGAAIQGTKGGGFLNPVYTYVLPSGAPMQVSAASFGALKVLVNGQPVQYGRKLAATDYLLAALPLPAVEIDESLYGDDATAYLLAIRFSPRQLAALVCAVLVPLMVLSLGASRGHP